MNVLSQFAFTQERWSKNKSKSTTTIPRWSGCTVAQTEENKLKMHVYIIKGKRIPPICTMHTMIITATTITTTTPSTSTSMSRCDAAKPCGWSCSTLKTFYTGLLHTAHLTATKFTIYSCVAVCVEFSFISDLYEWREENVCLVCALRISFDCSTLVIRSFTIALIGNFFYRLLLPFLHLFCP